MKNFPGKKLANKNLCHWHNLKENQIKKFRKIKLDLYEEKEFFYNLSNIGYGEIKRPKFNENKNYLIQAFQRRYRQELINGAADKECFLISKNLLK